MNSDVLIIGGGVIGLSIARELRKKGAAKITVLERGEIGREASHAAAGMLAPNAETDKLDDFFHFCNQSNQLYPVFSEELLSETGIDIELERSGTFYLALRDADLQEIRRRYERQKSAGLNVERLSAAEIRRAEPFVSPDVREGLFFPSDWQVENRKLIAALTKFAELHEINIVTGAEVKKLLKSAGKIIGAETNSNRYFSEKIVLTTGAWTSLIEIPDFKLPLIKPIRGQILSYKTVKRLFFHVIYSPRGYIVPRLDGKIVAGATVEDVGFENKTTDAGIDYICENAAEIAPNLANLEISEKWSGLRPFAADGLPILGSFPQAENLFIATAHYRNGILLTPLTARIMAEKIANNSGSEYLDIFGVRRFRQSAAGVDF